MRITKEERIYGDARYVEISGLSTETKPEEDFVTGSILTTVDDGKVFFFNEDGADGSKWIEQFSFQG